MPKLSLIELAKITGGELHGDGQVVISGLAAMDKAGQGRE